MGWKAIHFGHDPWLAKILERSALAFKSYRPETLAAEEEFFLTKEQEKRQNSDKIIRHSWWGIYHDVPPWCPYDERTPFIENYLGFDT